MFVLPSREVFQIKMLFLVIALLVQAPHLNYFRQLREKWEFFLSLLGLVCLQLKIIPMSKWHIWDFGGEGMYATTVHTFYPSILQNLFSKNKDMFLHNHNTITNIKNLTFIQYYCLIHSPYANVSNCSCNILYSSFLGSRFALGCHFSLVFKLEHFLRSYFAFWPWHLWKLWASDFIG